jgi:hypothetical protein
MIGQITSSYADFNSGTGMAFHVQKSGPSSAVSRDLREIGTIPTLGPGGKILANYVTTHLKQTQ